MSSRDDTRSSLPLLPFNDDIDAPEALKPAQRSPRVFISYSHETQEHDERVLNLAKRLRSDGVDCEIDSFQVSPSEGWPIWMQRETQDADFVIAVCTETYARRFAGKETSGKGKGATWEGRLIQQYLYDEEGNSRIIPVVFEQGDVDHIPPALKGATYYDLSTGDGYDLLHRALTNQPKTLKPPIGPIRRQLPELEPDESAVLALLNLCPDPLPLEVVSRLVRQDVHLVPTTLSRLVAQEIVVIAEDTVRLEIQSANEMPDASEDSIGAALKSLLDFVQSQHGAAQSQMMNIATLAKAADIGTAAAEVSRTFRTLQSCLKSSGNKRLVLDVARRSIEASRAPGRQRAQVEDEALTTICGVSWVYQRIGRLSAALAEAEHSLDLGREIGWDRNTAFCYKCLGRLKRMQAESVQDPKQRARLLTSSARLLQDAIREFTKLKLAAEVGDSYSLLARTHLVAGDREAASDAIKEAYKRLVDQTNKDYLDLQLLVADFNRHSDPHGAEALYGDVLEVGDGNGDAQKSEIMARAYFRRGKARTALGDNENALDDFRQAAEIWDAIQDPSADFAHWEIERTAPWIENEAEQLLMCEPVGVRVRAVQIVNDALGQRPVAKSHRNQVPEEYLRGVIAQAREKLAVDRPVW